MKREELTALGLDGIQTDKVMELYGQGVEKHKQAAASEKARADGLQAQLAQRDQDLASLTEKAQGSDALSAQLEEMKTQYAAERQNLEQQLAQNRLDNGITVALMQSQARDVAAVKAMLDLSKVAVGEDGTVTGLSDQLEALKQEKAWAFGGEQLTQYTPKDGKEPADAFHFNFAGVRTPDTKQ